MKCPACGREMEPGYLQSDRPVGLYHPAAPPCPGWRSPVSPGARTCT